VPAGHARAAPTLRAGNPEARQIAKLAAQVNARAAAPGIFRRGHIDVMHPLS
jgi:hypothetical protein